MYQTTREQNYVNRLKESIIVIVKLEELQLYEEQ